VRNRILSITRSTIPYVKEIMPLAKTVTGCILMQQLDYWFERYPHGFWKFQDATPNNSLYKPGDSWREELGFSLVEFRTAFDKIGVRYVSKSEWIKAVKAGVSFDDKFYASYIDRRAGVTHYRRNHQRLDAALDRILRQFDIEGADEVESAEGIDQETRDAEERRRVRLTNKNAARLPAANALSQFAANPPLAYAANELAQSAANAGNLFRGIEKLRSLEIRSPNLLYTENTVAETTLRPLLPHLGEGISSNMKGIEWPKALDPAERAALNELLEVAPNNAETRQKLVNELARKLELNEIRVGPIPYFRELVRRANSGEFRPSAGEVVRKRRARQQAIDAASAASALEHPDAPVNACQPIDSREAIAQMNSVLKRQKSQLQ
jgi:hypothetical protein